MSHMKKTLAIFLMLLTLLALFMAFVVWGAVWAGLALSVLWAWFVEPLFGVPGIGLWQAYGLMLVCTALRGWSCMQHVRNSQTAAFLVVVQPPLVCGLLLLVGWCVQSWI